MARTTSSPCMAKNYIASNAYYLRQDRKQHSPLHVGLWVVGVPQGRSESCHEIVSLFSGNTERCFKHQNPRECSRTINHSTARLQENKQSQCRWNAWEMPCFAHQKAGQCQRWALFYTVSLGKDYINCNEWKPSDEILSCKKPCSRHHGSRKHFTNPCWRSKDARSTQMGGG